MRSKTTELPTRSSACVYLFGIDVKVHKIASAPSNNYQQTQSAKKDTRLTPKDGQITEPNITFCRWRVTRSNALFINQKNTDSVHGPQLETSLCVICIILNILSLRKTHSTTVAMASAPYTKSPVTSMV